MTEPTTAAEPHPMEQYLAEQAAKPGPTMTITKAAYVFLLEQLRAIEARQQDDSATAKAYRFIGGITPDEWATIDKAKEAAAALAALPPSTPAGPRDFGQQWDKAGPDDPANRLMVDR